MFMFLLEWWQCSWLKVVRILRWCRVHGRGGDKRLSKERSECNWFPFFCMSLYTSLYGAMTASFSQLNIRNLFIKWPTSKKWLTNSCAIWSPCIRALVVSQGLCTESSSLFMEPCQLFKNLSEISSMRVENFWVWTLLKLGILLWELHVLWLDILYFTQLVRECPEVVNGFKLKLFSNLSELQEDLRMGSIEITTRVISCDILDMVIR